MTARREPSCRRSPYIRTISTAVAVASILAAGGALADDGIFGDWGGYKTYLADRGIAVSLGYTTESAANVSGGLRTGAAYSHQFALGVDVDWQKVAGWHGFKTHMMIINREGDNASAKYIGDTVIQAQEIYGAGFSQVAKLVYLYGEQSLLDGKLDLAFGRIAPGIDFASSSLFCNFMTLTICGHNRALSSQQGFEDWPMSVWGGRARFRPSSDTYIMVGAYQSQPFPSEGLLSTQGGESGWNWSMRGTTGVSVPVEFAYEPKVGPSAMPGHYKIGYNWDTSGYRDNFIDATGQPLALTGQPGLKHDGRGQFWVQADQMVMRYNTDPDAGLILIGSYARDPSDTTLFENFFWAGFINRGFWDRRPKDQLNFGVSYYTVSDKLRATQAIQKSLGQPLAGGALGVQTNAVVIEVNYGIQVMPGLKIQPEFEYFIRPGATKDVHDAAVIGLKTVANF